MAEISNIARPYARAIFELARTGGDYAHWSDMLAVMVMVSVDANMSALFANPRVSRYETGRALADVCGEHINDQGRNLVRLLGQNRRLHVLPAIAEQYERLRAEAERTIRAELESALPITAEEQQTIATALKKRLGREVKLVCSINEDLIGGAVIRAGDLVIDGSARARLEKLAVTIGV